jgi:hypothetical protein
MKTKSIFIILFALALLTSASLRRCICDEVQSHFQAKKHAVASSSIDDACNDCGHQKSCCASNEKAPAGLSLEIEFEFLDYIAIAEPIPIKNHRATRNRQQLCNGTRAPPLIGQINAYTLNQQLLV